MSKGQQALQENFLQTICAQQVPVSVYLINGIKLHGVIEDFDQFVIMLKNSSSQMVYKHAISTVVPLSRLNVPETSEKGGASEKDH